MVVQKHVPGCCCAGCTATLHVHATNNCTGADLAGVSLTASKSGQSDVTGTTSFGGLADLVVPAAGTWSVQGVKSGYTTRSVNATAVCGATTDVALPLVQSGQVTNRTVIVRGCGNPTLPESLLPGATVELLLGGTTVVATGITNASGQYVFADVPAGSYTIRATYSPQFDATASSSFTVTCGSSGSTTIIMAVNSAYTCYGASGGFTACFPVPIPKALYLTDSTGTYALVFVSNVVGWRFCYTYSATGYTRTVSGGSCTGGQAITSAIGYQLGRNGGTSALTQQRPVCGTLEPSPGSCSSNQAVADTFYSILNSVCNLTVVSCHPFSATFTVPVVSTINSGTISE